MKRRFLIFAFGLALSACASNATQDSAGVTVDSRAARRAIAGQQDGDCETATPVGAQCACKVSHLHPTQLAVGLRSVEEKEEKIHKKKKDDKLDEYLAEHPEPTVIGPRGTLYIIDHHHLARALFNQDVKHTYCQIRENFSQMGLDAFWETMNKRAWVYPYDENGRGPVPYSEIPDTVSALKDDPYRSLSAAVRDAGGYEKTPTPFAEFKWADFFRTRIEKHELHKDFERAIERGLELARSPQASGLPGYLAR